MRHVSVDEGPASKVRRTRSANCSAPGAQEFDRTGAHVRETIRSCDAAPARSRFAGQCPAMISVATNLQTDAARRWAVREAVEFPTCCPLIHESGAPVP